MPQDPTKRFSCRVSDYAKYRPAYPAAILDRESWNLVDFVEELLPLQLQ
ncbi:MAG: hypothetical protein V3S30_11665 [Thermoanaerobaculia bacterium]